MNALEVKNVTKTFKSFKLDNVSLTLPEGCIMGLIGENGAGKSTLIKLILDMLHKESGTITILGKDNTDSIKLTKEQVGVVTDEVGIPECLKAEQVGKIMKHTFKYWDDSLFRDYLSKLDIPRDRRCRTFPAARK